MGKAIRPRERKRRLHPRRAAQSVSACARAPDLSPARSPGAPLRCKRCLQSDEHRLMKRGREETRRQRRLAAADKQRGFRRSKRAAEWGNQSPSVVAWSATERDRRGWAPWMDALRCKRRLQLRSRAWRQFSCRAAGSAMSAMVGEVPNGALCPLPAVVTRRIDARSVVLDCRGVREVGSG
jgi:hypothetical protein